MNDSIEKVLSEARRDVPTLESVATAHRLPVTGGDIRLLHAKPVRSQAARPVVMIPGFGVLPPGWHDWWSVLHERAEVFYIETREKPTSTLLEGSDLSMDAFSSDIAAGLSCFGLEDAEMVGVLGEWVSAVRTRQEYTRDLEIMANHDRLTGLLNRAAFSSILEGRIGRMSDPRQPTFSVLFLDLNGFKPINDTLGHLVGDSLLQVVAKRLEDTLRSVDRASRCGGDEFVLLLEGLDLASAEKLGERVRGVLLEPIDLQGHTVHIDCSYGVVEQTPGLSAKGILRHAERMYDMKRLMNAARCS